MLKAYLHPIMFNFVSFAQSWVWVLGTFSSHIDGLVQGCSNSIANTLELQQSCTKSVKYHVK